MVKDSVVIQLASGLETRPIAMLVQVASQFESSIHPVSYTHLTLPTKSVV